jgi:type III pantothenate kinase
VNLCIDIGNTRVKMAVFQDREMLDYEVMKNPGIRAVRKKVKKFNVEKAIISSTRNLKEKFIEQASHEVELIILDEKTSLPVKSKYETPETLGTDRIASVIGAFSQSQGSTCLVIDIGTCITYDLISRKGVYLGGNISPGMYLKIKGMHNYTDKLPLVEIKINKNIVGTSTVKALQNGAFYGTKGEIESFIRQFKDKHDDLLVFFTGGDAQLFAYKIESKIFVRPHLVLEGLNEILKYNAA